jgi:hypothetical protein
MRASLAAKATTKTFGCNRLDAASSQAAKPCLGQVWRLSKHGPGALNEESSQIAIAAFLYVPENRSIAGRDLLRHKTKPGHEVAALLEGVAGSDRRDHRAGDDRPDPGCAHEATTLGVLIGESVDLLGD